jgi:D-psicose/D-tagatose/L-ribulose 3-epimerase
MKAGPPAAKGGIGINTWVWTSPFGDDSLELVSRAQTMGFDVFEVAVEDPSRFAGDRLAEALRSSGLRPVACGAFGPSRDLTHEDSKFRRESLEYIGEVLKLCERWDARIFAGPMYSAVGKRRQVSADQKRKEWDLAVAGIRKAGMMAADHGVVLAIEPLNRFETDLVNTAAQVVMMVEEIAHPNVKIHLDTFHMMIEEKSLLDAIVLAGPRLVHFHACESNRGTPGTGLVPWDQVADGLRTIGYGGDLVIESFTPECVSIAAAAAIWRPLAPSQDALARDGLAFLRRLVSRI